MAKSVLSEKDLDVEEKKVMGRIIDMWSLGSETDPYSQSTISRLINTPRRTGSLKSRSWPS